MSEDDKLPLIPAARARRPGIRGIPLQIGADHWFLPSTLTAPAYDAYRDRILDSITTRGRVNLLDIQAVAWSLLSVHYDLTPSETHTLLSGTERQELTDTIVECLVGNQDPIRTYSQWVRSALISNGLDHKTIDPEDLPHVLHQLVLTKRAAPWQDFVTSCVIANKRAKLLEG